MTAVDYVDRMAIVALRGDDLIGVARYDRWRMSEAEVAFFVDDANQGGGSATVLLEHLAVRRPRRRPHRLHGVGPAGEPQDDRGVHAGRLRGLRPASRTGVVEVRLGITPTPEAEAAIEERARSAASEAVRRLLVAEVGRGDRRLPRPGNVGQAVVHLCSGPASRGRSGR